MIHAYLPHVSDTRNAELLTNEGFTLDSISNVQVQLNPTEPLTAQFTAYIRLHVEEKTLPRRVPMEQFRQIMAKRAAQDEQWGGPNHDDTHSPKQWCEYIQKQLEQAKRELVVNQNPTAYRLRLEDIAALALAAMETYDR